MDRATSTGHHLRVGTLNVRSTQGGNLESTLKSFWQMKVDVAVLTETKLTNDKHTTNRFGYSVCATEARSSSQGGVALAFNKDDTRFNMTLMRRWGPGCDFHQNDIGFIGLDDSWGILTPDLPQGDIRGFD